MILFFKSVSEVGDAVRKLSEQEKDILRRVSFHQCVTRNNGCDEGWVLMKDVGGSRQQSLRKIFEVLVEKGFLRRQSSEPVRYRIPDFTSSTK